MPISQARCIADQQVRYDWLQGHALAAGRYAELAKLLFRTFVVSKNNYLAFAVDQTAFVKRPEDACKSLAMYRSRRSHVNLPALNSY